MKALLVVDMQVGGFKPETPRWDAAGVISRIDQLAQLFRQNNYPVIYIQHDGTKENNFLPGTADWEILPEIKPDSKDIIVSKTANDPYYKTKLQEQLIKLIVEEVVVTGWASDFCVDATVRSSLNNNYKVTVVKDGHTTGERPHASAELIIEHHNWIWSNLTPTKSKVRVIEFEKLVKELQ